MDGRGYQRKVWDHPMLMRGLMMVVVAEGMEKRKVEARYVEKGCCLEVSFCCLYPRTVSLVTALQRS